jgi:hypothetical protein
MKRAVLALGLVACVHRPLPAPRPQQVLYRDLERIVTIENTKGWGVDRQELESLLSASLDSVCRTEPPERRALLAWLDAEIARHGGPVEQAWRERGKKMSRIEHLLTLTRIHMVLSHADRAADTDCSFWVEPDPHFGGRQISDDRWELTGGGGGIAIGVVQGDQGDLQFGGTGRLLLGRWFGDSNSVYAGMEVAASGSFPKDEETGERGQLVVAIDAVPILVYRHTFLNSYFELEAGIVGHATEQDPMDVERGFHAGVAFGGRATRTRFFFPGAAFGISYERVFTNDGPDLQFLKAGLRVAFDVDL